MDLFVVSFFLPFFFIPLDEKRVSRKINIEKQFWKMVNCRQRSRVQRDMPLIF